MRYAINKDNKKIEVSFSGEKARCPDCNSIITGKKGLFKVEHWSHIAKNNCDSWHEPITLWHLRWQNYFPEELREVRVIDKVNAKSHRADIRLKNGLVIEVQNSSIDIQEIMAREKVYGDKNMIWILNGDTLTKKCRITYQFNRKRHALYFSIPTYSERIEKYDMDNFKSLILGSNFFNELREDEDLIDFKLNNGNYFKFEFNSPKKFTELSSIIDHELKKICTDLYGFDGYLELASEIDISHIDISKDNFSSVHLEKKYWRDFIDLMKFPVFIDNIPGLESHLIYWYQENRIIKRSDGSVK